MFWMKPVAYESKDHMINRLYIKMDLQAPWGLGLELVYCTGIFLDTWIIIWLSPKSWSLVRYIYWMWPCCTISVNSAGHVMHYMPAEILISAYGGNDYYIDFFFSTYQQAKGQVKVAVVMERGRRRSLTNIIQCSGGITMRIMSGWRNEKLWENRWQDQWCLQQQTCAWIVPYQVTYPFTQAWAGLHFNIFNSKSAIQ